MTIAQRPFFNFSSKRKEYDPRHQKTPLLKRERGFLLGGKRNCSIKGIIVKARYRAKGIVRILQNRIFSVPRISSPFL